MRKRRRIHKKSISRSNQEQVEEGKYMKKEREKMIVGEKKRQEEKMGEKVETKGEREERGKEYG